MTRAELLELMKKARKQLKKYHVPMNEQTVTLSLDTLENVLSEQPEIVRCKDCKNAEPAFDGKMSRCKIRGLMKNDWFCADGNVKDRR